MHEFIELFLRACFIAAAVTAPPPAEPVELVLDEDGVYSLPAGGV